MIQIKQALHTFSMTQPSLSTLQTFYDQQMKTALNDKRMQEEQQLCSEQSTYKKKNNSQQPSQPRTIFLNYQPSDVKYPKNIVRTQKYYWPTFLFVCILEQFTLFSNQYFLFVSITQIFPSLKVGLAFTYYLPLIMVICISVGKEFFDDLNRWRRDNQVNAQIYDQLLFNGQIRPQQSNSIQPGDIIKLVKNQRAPADLLVLQTKDESGVIYIRTDNLDGEIDWKTRKSIAFTQKLPYETGLNQYRGAAICPALSKDIYQFNGRWLDFTEQNFDFTALNYENTIWQNCVISSDECLCLVIHSGKDTRSAMNTAKPRVKQGKTDIQMNLFVKGLFVFLVLLALVFTLASGDASFLLFLRFFVLYNNIIPLSLKVVLDIGKLLLSYGIGHDKSFNKIQVNTTSIPEQLGKITHIFSDKTGTLTRNVMKVQKIVCGDTANYNGALDVQKAFNAGLQETKLNQESQNKARGQVCYSDMRNRMATINKKQETINDGLSNFDRLHYLLTSMATCHSVSIQNGELLASSPDEIALVQFAGEVGFRLQARSDDQMVISGFSTQVYKIKYVFPFNSVTKRMGIVLERDEKYYLYVKGADTVITKLLENNYGWLQEKIDELSAEGLRTLVFAFKQVSADQFDDFSEEYKIASSKLTDREQAQTQCENKLFQQLLLVGITGVEDQLQQGVRNCLEQFRAAGIRTWILSGDKVQTIQCIALSSGLIDPKISKFKVIEAKTHEEALKLLKEVNIQDCLVIDGNSINLLLGQRPIDYYLTHKLVEQASDNLTPLSIWVRLQRKIGRSFRLYLTGTQPSGKNSLGKNDVREEFARIASKLPAVCCCRCSPDQKALICSMIGRYCGTETAGVGDGANDCSLLSAASVSFGLFGKEGVQAAMAADYALGEFQDLRQLIFWHGRSAYKNTVEAAQYVIQRGITGCLIQAWFSAVYFFNSVVLYTGFLMLGYVVIYNQFACMVIYVNEDIDHEVAVTYPELYRQLTRGRHLSIKTFFVWVGVALAVSFSILFFSNFIVQGNFTELILVSFTALTLVQLELICLTVQRWTTWMIGIVFLSLLAFWFTLFMQLDQFSLEFILSWQYIWKSAAAFSISGGSVWLIWIGIKLFQPDTIYKLRFTQEKSKCCGCCNALVHSKSSTGNNYFNFGSQGYNQVI